MSTKTMIYDDIETALNTILKGTVKDIQHIAIWNNQLANDPQERSYNTPAVFIDFGEILWEESKIAGTNAGALSATGQTEEQEGIMIFTLHQVFKTLKNETLSFTETEAIVQKIYYVIQNLQGANKSVYNPCIRIAERTDPDHDGIIDYTADFSMRVAQCGQSINSTEVDTGIIDIEIEAIT